MNPVKRILWIDIARAIGISLVVYGHVLRGLASAGMVSRQSSLFSSDYAIYTFHMPLFFLLSGLNAEHSLSKGRRRFILEKLWTIAYPYVLWSLIQGSIQITLSRYINAPPTIHDMFTILWIPQTQFWFLYALFIIHLLAVIFSARLKILAPLAIITFSHFVLCAPPILKNVFFNIEYMLPFYVLGIFLGRDVSRITIKLNLLGSVCLALAVTYALGVYWGRFASHQSEYSLASVPACIAGMFLVIALSQFIEHLARSTGKYLAVLGSASMTIYILHILAGPGSRVILNQFGIHNIYVHLVIGTVVGIFAPLLAYKFFALYKLLTPLGLAPLYSAPRSLDAQVDVAPGVVRN